MISHSMRGRMAGRYEGTICPQEEGHSGRVVQWEYALPGRFGKHQRCNDSHGLVTHRRRVKAKNAELPWDVVFSVDLFGTCKP